MFVKPIPNSQFCYTGTGTSASMVILVIEAGGYVGFFETGLTSPKGVPCVALSAIEMLVWLGTYLFCLALLGIGLVVDAILILQGERSLTWHAQDKWWIYFVILILHQYISLTLTMHLAYD